MTKGHPIATAAGNEVMVTVERCIIEARNRRITERSLMIAALRDVLAERAAGLNGVDRVRAHLLGELSRAEASTDRVLGGYVLPRLFAAGPWINRKMAVDDLRARWQATAGSLLAVG